MQRNKKVKEVQSSSKKFKEVVVHPHIHVSKQVDRNSILRNMKISLTLIGLCLVQFTLSSHRESSDKEAPVEGKEFIIFLKPSVYHNEKIAIGFLW